MNDYKEYYHDYLIINGVRLTFFSIPLVIGPIVLKIPLLMIFIGAVYVLVLSWFLPPLPLRKLITILRDIKECNFVNKKGVVTRFSRDSGSIFSGDKFRMSIQVNDSGRVESFTGLKKDIIEDFLEGDHVEIRAMRRAKIVTSVIKIND